MTRPDNAKWRDNYFPRVIPHPVRQASWGETLRYAIAPLFIVACVCIPVGLLGGLALLAWGL